MFQTTNQIGVFLLLSPISFVDFRDPRLKKMTAGGESTDSMDIDHERSHENHRIVRYHLVI